MSRKCMVGAALTALLGLTLAACESVPSENGGTTSGPPPVAASTAQGATARDGTAPQIDLGTFGITQVDPASGQPITGYPVAWAWRPVEVPNREIWLLYKPNAPEHDGWLTPGQEFPDISLHVVFENRFDPPGTHWEDGIDQADYDAFREWVRVEFMQRWPDVPFDKALLEVSDHELVGP